MWMVSSWWHLNKRCCQVQQEQQVTSHPSVTFITSFCLMSSCRSVRSLSAGWGTARRTTWCRTPMRYDNTVTQLHSISVGTCDSSSGRGRKMRNISNIILIIVLLWYCILKKSLKSSMLLSIADGVVLFIFNLLFWFFKEKNSKMFPASKCSLLPTVLTSPRLCDCSFNWLHWFCRRSRRCRTSSSCGSWRRGSRCWRWSRWSSSTSLCPSSMTETQLTSSTTSSGWDGVRQRDRKQEALLHIKSLPITGRMEDFCCEKSPGSVWSCCTDGNNEPIRDVNHISVLTNKSAALFVCVSCLRGWPPTWTWIWTSATSSRSTPPSSCLPETSWSCSSTSR